MELRPLVLALLEAKPMYGYELVQAARRKGRLNWEEGTLYPLLHRLEGEKILASEWRRAPGGKERKYYRLTRSGKAALAAARVEWKASVRTVSSILLGGSHA